MSEMIGARKQSLVVRLLILLTMAVGMNALFARTGFAANESVLYSFGGTPDGASPAYNLIRDTAGNLYGVTADDGVYGGGIAFELSLQSGVWTESILHSFGGPGDDFGASGGLTMDAAGNLYGVAYGGENTGMVYQLSPDGHGNWTETILKTFGGSFSIPMDGLTMDAEGNLYGVVEAGGSQGYPRNGAVFELSPPPKTAKNKQWKYKVLYKFLSPKTKDGSDPNGDLVLDAAGNLYGTANRDGLYGCGNVFELSPGAKTWTEKILYSFRGLTDGCNPGGGLIADASGNFYGVTETGGLDYSGVVFAMSSNAGNWTETVLYSFTGGSDGSFPIGTLTLRDDHLYGVTLYGGNPPGIGVVFELLSSGDKWTEKALHVFTSSPDGSGPLGGVTFDPKGNLYGTTLYGGTSGNGVVYEISK